MSNRKQKRKQWKNRWSEYKDINVSRAERKRAWRKEWQTRWAFYNENIEDTGKSGDVKRGGNMPIKKVNY